MKKRCPNNLPIVVVVMIDYRGIVSRDATTETNEASSPSGSYSSLSSRHVFPAKMSLPNYCVQGSDVPPVLHKIEICGMCCKCGAYDLVDAAHCISIYCEGEVSIMAYHTMATWCDGMK